MTTNGKFSQAQLATISSTLARFEKREREKRRLEAEQLADLAEALGVVVALDGRSNADREMGYRSLRLELAAMMHASEHMADKLLSTAYDAVTHLPLAVDALAQGKVSLAHVQVMSSEACPLPKDDAPESRSTREVYDTAVTAFALQETPTRLRPIARALAAAQSQQSAEQLHERAVANRSVHISEDCDGMADLIAHLPAVEAHAIFDRITHISKAVPLDVKREPEGSGQRPRRLDAVRADVFADLLLGGIGTGGAGAGEPGTVGAGDAATGASSGNAALNGSAEFAAAVREQSGRINAQIQVIVPGELVGMTGTAIHTPRANQTLAAAPELVGFGPIDPVTARHLASDTDAWEVVSVDVAGAVLQVDRYRPTPQMKRLLSARDLHCRAPGCRVPAHRCDIDHTHDAALGGETRTDNLAHLCRGHHTLKHHTDWKVEQRDDGVMTWTSPTGREHIDRPGSRVRFRREHDGY